MKALIAERKAGGPSQKASNETNGPGSVFRTLFKQVIRSATVPFIYSTLTEPSCNTVVAPELSATCPAPASRTAGCDPRAAGEADLRCCRGHVRQRTGLHGGQQRVLAGGVRGVFEHYLVTACGTLFYEDGADDGGDG
ncbi:hypothetical protein F4811DRAFT_554777 [Daldinia bambusicola]|nr:hypothetical protein F4811DRAFT_554777 [Daldinia bambusicola]